MLSIRRSLSPRATKSRSRRMTLPGPQGLLGRFVERLADHDRRFVRTVGQKPPRSPHVIGDGGERLVQLVRQRRCHFAHRGQPRNMHQLGLQLLQPRLGALPLGQIADEAGEKTLIVRAHLADRKLHRKGRAVLALADDDAADADDARLVGPQVTGNIAVVLLAIGRGHHDLDVLADDFARLKAEQPFGGGAERLNAPLHVDDDHRFRDRVEDRLQVRLARERGACARRRLEAGALETLAKPRHADAHQRKRDRAGDIDDEERTVNIDQRPVIARDEDLQQHGVGGGDKSRPEAPGDARDQDRRHQKQIQRLVAERWSEPGAQQENERYQPKRQKIGDDGLLAEPRLQRRRRRPCLPSLSGHRPWDALFGNAFRSKLRSAVQRQNSTAKGGSATTKGYPLGMISEFSG